MAPPAHATATVVLGLALVGLLLVGSHRHSRTAKLPRRATRSFVFRNLAWQLVLAMLLGLAFLAGGATPRSVGVSGAMAPGTQLLLGALFYRWLLLVLTLARTTVALFGLVAPSPGLHMIRPTLSLWPRSRDEKVLQGIAVCVLNPFTEEILMRGVLVHQLGLVLGASGPAILLGALLNGALHMYQGWRAQHFHLSFYVLVVWILHTPLGLLGCIGVHVVGDALPIATLKSTMQELRRLRRIERRAVQITPGRPAGSR